MTTLQLKLIPPVLVYFEGCLVGLQWNHNLFESPAVVESVLECDLNTVESPSVGAHFVDSYLSHSVATQSVVLVAFA